MYVNEFRDRFGVEPICAVLSELSRARRQDRAVHYYAHLACPVSPAVLDEAHLVNALVTLHRANFGVYGVRKMWHLMTREGFEVGAWTMDQVGRLMAIGGVSGAVRGRHRTRTTLRDSSAPRHPDLLQLVKRNWTGPTAPDQLWVADFTYVWTLAGFVYVSFITDVFSRRILGWRVTTTKETPLVSAALQQALFTRRRTESRFTATGLVHHSDAGSQYTSLAFSQELHDAQIAGSIGTVGDALDNALMESTIGLYKTELIHTCPRTWTSRAEVERETARWVAWFNTTRLHSLIGYRKPLETETHYRQSTTAASAPDVA